MGRTRGFDEQDILQKATEIFWRNGFNGTSISDLIDATGLAKASLYNAFGNKEDLFLTVLKFYIDQRNVHLIKPLDSVNPGRKALELYFDAVSKATIENKQTPGCLLVNTAAEQGIHDPKMRSIVDQGMTDAENFLKRTVARGVEDGSIDSSTDPEISGLCLINLVLGIRVMACKGIKTSQVKTLIQSSLDKHAPKPDHSA